MVSDSEKHTNYGGRQMSAVCVAQEAMDMRLNFEFGVGGTQPKQYGIDINQTKLCIQSHIESKVGIETKKYCRYVTDFGLSHVSHFKNKQNAKHISPPPSLFLTLSHAPARDGIRQEKYDAK